MGGASGEVGRSLLWAGPRGRDRAGSTLAALTLGHQMCHASLLDWLFLLDFHIHLTF